MLKIAFMKENIMKRITVIFLTVLMVLALSACGTGTTSGAADNTLGKPDDPLELAKQIAETEVLGDTLESAYQQGVPRALDWLDLYFMESSDPSPERRAEIEEQYPTTEELLYGISAAEASEAGWYDIWLAVHAELWPSDQQYYDENNGDYGVEQAEALSESKLRSINGFKVSLLATQWMNENNYSRSSGSKINNTRVLSYLASIQYSGSVAIVTTEVEYWIGGGTPTGSVYATVTIDIYTGDVLSASIG